MDLAIFVALLGEAWEGIQLDPSFLIWEESTLMANHLDGSSILPWSLVWTWARHNLYLHCMGGHSFATSKR